MFDLEKQANVDNISDIYEYVFEMSSLIYLDNLTIRAKYVDEAEIWYVQAYGAYQDDQGVTHEIYGNEIISVHLRMEELIIK